MSNDTPCLVVFCRWPRAGVGKQRLARDIGVDAAARVAAALWDCAREDIAAWVGDVALAVTDSDEIGWAEDQARDLRVSPAGVHATRTNTMRLVQVLVQPLGNLGERIMGVDAALRAVGYQKLVFIGSDAPALDQELLDAILAMLQHADVALSPADDGGVVAMAARQPWPLLTDLPWSSHLLGCALRDRCSSAGQGVSMTRGTFDVDDLASLRQAGTSLRDDARPARRRLVALARDLVKAEVP